ncbi:S1 family peptidase [Spirosoma montaniterrae]|uniref:Peptidase S1 domain-containing protein n=1 Tax=Spirosoma montaniterrae TaxID=1178516 RepID=A0A1P9WSR6_9BACT|nr:serine protease [Spirosoma montaniterrae]AQG78407.1 hypothetical protein AWR27_03080 [Spirosoma montaniterrae]
MFNQSDRLHDYVFPIAIASKDRSTDSYSYRELIGTGFLIGNNGYALTAAHVIDQLQDGIKSEFDVMIGLFQSDSNWYVFELIGFEKHPTEDVGIVKLQGEGWKSFLTVTDMPQNSSCEYHCWGFPRSIAEEMKMLDEDALERPELVFTQGYVRRRISRELYPTIIFRGTQFYEVSETIGGGASGGPLVLKSSVGQDKWKVFGIYVGEKEGGNVGYAVRAESFTHWTPNILQHSIINEANNV